MHTASETFPKTLVQPRTSLVVTVPKHECSQRRSGRDAWQLRFRSSSGSLGPGTTGQVVRAFRVSLRIHWENRKRHQGSHRPFRWLFRHGCWGRRTAFLPTAGAGRDVHQGCTGQSGKFAVAAVVRQLCFLKEVFGDMAQRVGVFFLP